MINLKNGNLLAIFVLVGVGFLSLPAQSNSFIRDYRVQPRMEPFGVADVGYPQVCIRVNTANERINMKGVMNELARKHPPEKMLAEATKLASTGDLGHVWTIIFDKPTAQNHHPWRSWSFRFPSSPTGNALNYNHVNDSPSRKFNYQYCVNVQDKNIDTSFLLANPIKSLVNESRQVASTFLPNVTFPEGYGVYTPLTPCVWFATRFFNYITNSNIPFEQPFDWSALSSMLNDPIYSGLNSMVDATVVAEAISKKVRHSVNFQNQFNVTFLHNDMYALYDSRTRADYYKSIAKNSYVNEELLRSQKDLKLFFVDGAHAYLLKYNGLLSKYDLNQRRYVLRDVDVNEYFPRATISVEDIKSSMPVYKNMPHYDANNPRHLIFMNDGSTYLVIPSKQELRRLDYFENYAPHLRKYVSKVLGTAVGAGDNILVYLDGRKYIEVNPISMIVIREGVVDEIPIVGKHLTLQ